MGGAGAESAASKEETDRPGKQRRTEQGRALKPTWGGEGGRRGGHGFEGVSVEENDSWRVTPKQTGGVEKLKEKVEG